MLRRAQLGLTLLETMLALAVASVMIMASIRQIQVWQLNSQIDALKGNIEVLFDAAAQYYRAKCPSLSATTTVTVAQLQSGGYLTTALAPSFIVDTSGGYAIQFTASTPTMNLSCGVTDCNYTNSPPGSVTQTISGVPVVFLQMQVSVLLKSYNQTKMETIEGAFNPTCMAASGTAACTATSSGNWMVLTRLPNYASAQTSSGYWESMPMLKEFNLQYTHDQMYELSNSSTYTPYPTSLLPQPGNYTCGE